MKSNNKARWDLNAIGSAFAEAAVDPTRWNAAMDSVAAGTGGFGAVMFPFRGRLPTFPFSPSLGATVEAYIRDGWIHNDERYRWVPICLQKGVATEFDFTNIDEIRRHPYYQEFLAPFNLRWAAITKAAAGDDVWCVSIQRTIEQGPFSPADQRKLAALSAQLCSATALACALGHARAESAFDAFEVSGTAVAMLDRNGHVWRLNRAGERVLGFDLCLSKGRLVSWNPEATQALDRALHAAIWSSEPAALLPPVVLPRREGRPILAYPSRPVGIARDVFSACQVILVLVDLEARPRLIETELRQAFRLTAAEARLANCMLAGEAVETAADHLGIAYETARNMLKRVLHKTDTHRQGELISVLGRFSFRANANSNGDGDTG